MKLMEILLNYLPKLIVLILSASINTLQLTFHMLSGSLFSQRAQSPNRALTHSVLNCDQAAHIFQHQK